MQSKMYILNYSCNHFSSLYFFTQTRTSKAHPLDFDRFHQLFRPNEQLHTQLSRHSIELILLKYFFIYQLMLVPHTPPILLGQATTVEGVPRPMPTRPVTSQHAHPQQRANQDCAKAFILLLSIMQ